MKTNYTKLKFLLFLSTILSLALGCGGGGGGSSSDDDTGGSDTEETEEPGGEFPDPVDIISPTGDL